MKLLFDAAGLAGRHGGTRRRIFALARAFAEREDAVAGLLVDADEDAAEVERVNTPWVFSQEGPCARGGRKNSRELQADLRTFEADFVIGTRAGKGPAECGQILDLRGVPAEGSGLRALSNFRKASEIWVPSHAVSNAVLMRWPRLEARLRTVPDGVDTEVFKPQAGADDQERLAAHQLERDRYLLFVGALDSDHGVDMALAVRARLLERAVDLPLVIVGQGPLLPEEDLLALSSGRPNQTIGSVLRGVRDHDLSALYRNARIVLAPATQSTSALVPLEALACGTAVIAADIPAHRSALGSGIARYMPPLDIDAWDRAVLDEIYERPFGPNQREAGLALARSRRWPTGLDKAFGALSASL